MEDFRGLGTAMITPFHKGEVDLDCYKRLLIRQREAGVDFIVALGTTAETPCLSAQERCEIARVTKENFNGPVVMGVGTNSLTSTIENIELLDEFEPDCWLVVVPYYNKPSQRGLIEYFTAVANNTSRNILLYNVPERTGVNMSPETVSQLANIPNIIGIKEACSRLDHFRKVRETTPSQFKVFSGNDGQWLEEAICGAEGVISVVSNLIPERMVALQKSLNENKLDDAILLNNELQPVYRACFAEGNPVSVKGCMSLEQLCENDVRLPLVAATDETVSLWRRVKLSFKL